MKNRGLRWAAAFLVLFALGAGSFMLLRAGGNAGRVARVYLDGALLREIDLAAVAAPYEFEVGSTRGSNTVRVSHGAIAVSAADCPDQVCVRQGEISDDAVPIVCMPHRLVIEIEGDVD